MKKALLYVISAILLGTLTMFAPLVLLIPSFYELPTSAVVNDVSTIFEALDDGDETYGEREALEGTLGSSDLSSAGLMLLSSFLLALCVSVFFRKRLSVADYGGVR